MAKPSAVSFFESQIPFHRFLGLEVRTWAEGNCRMAIPARPDELTGDPFRPALHGGIVAALADAAGGLAVFLELGFDRHRMSTVDIRVDYLLPARIDQELLADAVVLRVGNRVGVADVRVHHGDPTQAVALARATYSIVQVPR